MGDLEQTRQEIDRIDDRIIELFQQRMKVSEEIADYKRENKMAVLDRSREREKVADVASKVPADLRTEATVLEQLLMSASRLKQRADLEDKSPIEDEIAAAVKDTPELFPTDEYVACQGVEGAYSQIAAERIFKRPNINYFDHFEGVFRAVEQGFCRYGVLPLENSTAGSVNSVYDLMMRHDFHIVRSCRLKVDHSLLAKPGVKLEDVREIFSHQQALTQCVGFLDGLKDVQVHVCANTAEAAQRVAESDRTDVAALSSHSCAELYGLRELARDVQDKGNNYTRFACISKDLEIYPGSERSSLMAVLSHEPGALFKVLGSFYALDINLVKLESRPLPDRDFEFMFYFDIECPVAAPEFAALIGELDATCEELRYLGSYSELV